MIIQSYGGGVQSIAMLYMSLEGLLPKFDRVVFADTGAEPQHVYDCVMRDEQICKDNGIPFNIVQFDDLSKLDKKAVFIPAFTISEKNGQKGHVIKAMYTAF